MADKECYIELPYSSICFFRFITFINHKSYATPYQYYHRNYNDHPSVLHTNLFVGDGGHGGRITGGALTLHQLHSVGACVS